MKIVNAIENGAKPQPTYWFKDAIINISDIKQMIRIWPATMFANNLIIKAKGLVNIPKISTGTRMIRLFANLVF